MPSDMLKEISKARLNSAKERIEFAKQIQEIGDYKTVANRSYYAAFCCSSHLPYGKAYGSFRLRSGRQAYVQSALRSYQNKNVTILLSLL